jgi:DNA-binding CsgD family transcriptional regulator
MTPKDIASITGQSINSIETARYRLRKKLGITNQEINLVNFFLEI